MAIEQAYEKEVKRKRQKILKPAFLKQRNILLWNRQKMKLTKILYNLRKSKSSEVLTAYLKQCDQPPWTSYFIKVSKIYG